MMGTRPGDLDPGVLLYLLRERRYTPAELDDVLTNDAADSADRALGARPLGASFDATTHVA